MQIEEAFKELERGVKKFPPIFLIYLYISLVRYFEVGYFSIRERAILHSDKVFPFVATRIQQLDSLDDVRKDLINGLLELQAPHQLKLDRIRYELNFPELAILKKTLVQLESDKRFANFCWECCCLSLSSWEAQTRYDDKLRQIDSIPLPLKAPGFAVGDWKDFEQKKRDKEKMTIFYDQAIQIGIGNPSLLANLELIKLQFKRGDKEVADHCIDILAAYQGILEVSNTIINKNMNLEGFPEWLLNYLKEKMPSFKISVHQSNNPITTVEDCKYVALRQLDYLYLFDRNRHNTLLKSIQSAWHKRTFDARKREDKLKKPTRNKTVRSKGS